MRFWFVSKIVLYCIVLNVILTRDVKDPRSSPSDGTRGLRGHVPSHVHAHTQARIHARVHTQKQTKKTNKIYTVYVHGDSVTTMSSHLVCA